MDRAGCRPPKREPLPVKPFRDQQLLDAIHQAIDRDRADRWQRAELAELRRRYEALTPREREVMALVVAGLLTKQDLVRMTQRLGAVRIILRRGSRAAGPIPRP